MPISVAVYFCCCLISPNCIISDIHSDYLISLLDYLFSICNVYVFLLYVFIQCVQQFVKQGVGLGEISYFPLKFDDHVDSIIN